MEVRVVTLRYHEGLQGFPEEGLTRAAAGREVLEVREHFFVHGHVPHLCLVLMLGNAPAPAGRRANQTEDPGNALPDELKPLYRDLRSWRNERAKQEGVPAYAIARNAMLAEICRKRPRSLSALKEIEGMGEASCEKYGRDILARIPEETSRDAPAPVGEAVGKLEGNSR